MDLVGSLVVEDSGSWRVLLGFRSSLSQVPGYAVLLIDTCLAGTSPHGPWIAEVLYEVPTLRISSR